MDERGWKLSPPPVRGSGTEGRPIGFHMHKRIHIHIASIHMHIASLHHIAFCADLVLRTAYALQRRTHTGQLASLAARVSLLLMRPPLHLPCTHARVPSLIVANVQGCVIAFQVLRAAFLLGVGLACWVKGAYCALSCEHALSARGVCGADHRQACEVRVQCAVV